MSEFSGGVKQWTPSRSAIPIQSSKASPHLSARRPTFYNHTDATASLSGGVYETKRSFIEKNGLVVWRFHDHWHARRPDGILTGMIAALGWEKFQTAKDLERFVLPVSSLDELTKSLRKQLRIRSLR